VRFFKRCRRQFGSFQSEFRQAVYGAGPIEVLCGPFVGMKYFDKIVWGPITPKWIGSFEAELHRVVGILASTAYDAVVDIGAAEGYYAVGLARALAEARIVTYDIDFIARRRQRNLAAVNGLSKRISVRGRCNHAKLQMELSAGRCVVISDIEGAEVELIDPELAPHLRRSDLLVECHANDRYTVADVISILRSRFESSHSIERIDSQDRIAEEWSYRHPSLREIHGERLSFALNEFRSHRQGWLWMIADDSR
jgi:hypothetical protein